MWSAITLLQALVCYHVMYVPTIAGLESAAEERNLGEELEGHWLIWHVWALFAMYINVDSLSLSLSRFLSSEPEVEKWQLKSVRQNRGWAGHGSSCHKDPNKIFFLSCFSTNELPLFCHDNIPGWWRIWICLRTSASPCGWLKTERGLHIQALLTGEAQLARHGLIGL